MKPRFVLREGKAFQVVATRTPRLKVRADKRELVLLRPASNPSGATVIAIRASLIAHYGSLLAFARYWSLPYAAVTAAFTHCASERAGAIRDVRQKLGLASEPSERACQQAYCKGLGLRRRTA